MNVYFVRHFKTLGNTQKRYIGRTDEALFQPELQLAPQGLPAQPDAIFVSPMLRCLQTKALLYPTQSHTVIDDLRELDFGVFEGLTYADLQDNPAYRNFIDGLASPPQGEESTAFRSRCAAAFGRIMQDITMQSHTAQNIPPQVPTAPPAQASAPQNIIIICHGGTIMSIVQAFAPKGETRGFYDHQIANGALLHCKWDGQALMVLPTPPANQ
ncbi:MAG: histidine phosphatase family protein [Faecalibacterium sp.]